MEQTTEQARRKRGAITDQKAVLYGLVVIEAVMWGFSFIGTKAALVKLTPMEVIAARWTLGAALLVALAAAGVIKVSFRGKRKLGLAVFTVFLQPCLYSPLEVYAISMTTTSESSIMIALSPVVVVLISVVFLHKRIDRLSAAAVFFAFCGVVIAIALGGDFSWGGSHLGYFLLALCVLCASAYTILSNSIDTFTPMEKTVLMAVMGSVFFNLLVLAGGRGLGFYRVCFTDRQTMLAILFLGVGCTFICYIIFNIVIAKLPPHIASSLQTNLVTLTGVLSGIIIKNDPWNAFTVLGLAMMLAGIVIVNLRQSKS